MYLYIYIYSVPDVCETAAVPFQEGGKPPEGVEPQIEPPRLKSTVELEGQAGTAFVAAEAGPATVVVGSMSRGVQWACELEAG